MLANKYIDWRFIYGMPANFWTIQANAVERFIKANKIQPVAQETLQMRSIADVPGMAREIADVPWWWKYGGMRVSHLHYAGELYLLNREQWKAFSGEIVKDFSAKLAEANSINFGQLMEISDVMTEIV